MTLGHELRTLNAMKNTELWTICISLSRELKDLDAMNSTRLWMK